MRSSEKRLFALIHWFGQFLKAKELTFAFQEEAGTLTAHILFEHRLANNDVLFAQTVNLLFITAAAGKQCVPFTPSRVFTRAHMVKRSKSKTVTVTQLPVTFGSACYFKT